MIQIYYIVTVQVFEDTDGFLQEIINAFANDYLFENVKKKKSFYKVFLVVGHDEITASRGDKMVKSLNRLEGMFRNEENWENGIGFIFTKTKNKTIENILDMIKNNPPKSLVKWINFIENHPDHVFFFPKPSKKQIGSQYDFDDHERLLEFIRFNPLVNPNQKTTFSENAILKMKEIRSIHLNNVSNKIQNICCKINEQFHLETSSEEIKRWIDIMQSLVKRKVKTAKDFGKVIQEIIPNWHQYRNDIKCLEEFELFDNFVDKVLYKIEDTSCINDVIRAWCDQCLYGLFQSHTQGIESEFQKKSIIEQKKMINEKERINKEYLQKLQELKKEMEDREIQFQKRIEQQKIENKANYDLEKKKIKNMISSFRMNENYSSNNSENEELKSQLEELEKKYQQLAIDYKKK